MAKQLLKAHADSFPLSRYEEAALKLSQSPNDRTAQHQAVLSLARLGATAFALQEYDRHGLHLEETDEDIISLKARMLKDLFLKSKKDNAKSYGLKSALQYDLAYQITGGYYSGINAATMYFLTDEEEGDYISRARKILNDLPSVKRTFDSDYYFTEATRAEAYLLLGDTDRARYSFRNAVSYDPLNYIAHAATLKQLGLIQRHRGLEVDWLSEFNPPRPVHFAGHIWTEGSMRDEYSLKIDISDLIQKHDIGFAYGALAAGSDIVMAESFIAEGVPLHITLPGDVETFRQNSVQPFGSYWVKRYNVCLAQATSVSCLNNPNSTSPKGQPAAFAAKMSMGQTILRSYDFSREPIQFLLLDDERRASLSHKLKEVWEKRGFKTIIQPINLGEKFEISHSHQVPEENWTFWNNAKTPTYIKGSPENLLNELLKIHSQAPDRSLVLDYGRNPDDSFAQALFNRSLPPTIFVSEAVAAHLTLYNPELNRMTYAGLTGPEERMTTKHVYTLEPNRT